MVLGFKQKPVQLPIEFDDPEDYAALPELLGSGQVVKIPSGHEIDAHRCDFPNRVKLKLPVGTKWKCDCGRMYRLMLYKKSRYNIMAHGKGHAWRNIKLERAIALAPFLFLALLIAGLPNGFAIVGLIASCVLALVGLFTLTLQADVGDLKHDHWHSSWE